MSTAYGVQYTSLNSFLKAGLTDITKLDLSDCYWFDPTLLTELITGLSSSLTILHIQGTRLCSRQIADILKCTKLSRLSASFSFGDTTFWKDEEFTSENTIGEALLSSCTFFEMKESISKLQELSLYGGIQAFKMCVIFSW